MKVEVRGLTPKSEEFAEKWPGLEKKNASDALQVIMKWIIERIKKVNSILYGKKREIVGKYRVRSMQ